MQQEVMQMLDAQIKRGLLEECVLSALCRGDSYGYQIIKDLAPHVEISESTLYPILRRLESDNKVSEYSVAHNGRLRKFYQITPVGRAQVKEFLDDWSKIQAMYEFIKGGIDRAES